MKINIEYGNNIVENLYLLIGDIFRRIINSSIPYFRRVLRFMALPYCYFKVVNWDECTASRLQVANDFFYIFFVLKYYPDNYSLCRLWEKDRKIWSQYYGSIYDPYQRGRLRLEVQKEEYKIVFEDKNICYQLCKVADLPLPKQYSFIDPTDDYKKTIESIVLSNPDKKFIIKPNRGKGGKGIVLCYKKNEDIIIQDKDECLYLRDYFLKKPAVLQEYIKQHNKLFEISPSTNTVRIVTLYTKNKDIIIVGALMRFGVGSTYIDNTSSGGLAVGIDIEHGVLKEKAYDFNSKVYYSHPTSKFTFKNFKIPYWNEVVELAKHTQKLFPYYKLLGFDIAIAPDGPLIIEINAEHDNVGIEQSYGPILNNPQVRNAFKDYNLLINKNQMEF